MAVITNMSPKELLEELTETGSVTISNEMEITETNHGNFLVRAVLSDDSIKRLFYSETIPTQSEVEIYKKSIDTVDNWQSGGYSSVNGWEYQDRTTMGREVAQWETMSSNYIRINSADFFTIYTSKISEMFIEKFQIAAYDKKPVELATAIILHSFTPRQFDYHFKKQLEMFRNLKDITGIGESTARELLVDFECETYKEAKKNILQTNIPKNYLRDASEELIDKVNSGEPLMDSSVTQKYSDVIVANSI